METALWNLLDLALAGLLVGLGWAAVSSPDLKRGVVLFIAFGLLLAITWALQTALSAADPERLAGPVAANLGDSGVSHAVTAVLLNFRAYDTLLELAVLLAAVLGIFALGPARPGFRGGVPVLDGMIRWLVPLLVITGGYLLWVGAHAPGGAFQASALLAAAAVLLRLGGREGAGLPRPVLQRWLLAGGVGVFLLVGLAVTAAGLDFLEYPRAWSGALILLIESFATLAIATTLALAYIGGRPSGWEETVSRLSTERPEQG